MVDTRALAKTLDKAARNAAPVPQISNEIELSLADAYKVQRQSIARRKARGETVIGIKVGFTSRAKMIQMGVHDLIRGQLTDAMAVEDGGELDTTRFIHPRIEPELAFMLNKPLSGRVSALQAMAAVEAIAPAMEIIDSRYADFKFSLEDVVADNASSSGFVVGPWRSRTADIANLGITMEFDGRPVQIGSSAAILGHPVRALVAAARLAGEAGMTLK
ncbi:MAG: 4-oxalocrotonate decarboxylase, partial [Gammaproteobacteria bacterium]|nr:4-oxalocrotonate decarboxylase [Gammaproteobacteria bacterium]